MILNVRFPREKCQNAEQNRIMTINSSIDVRPGQVTEAKSDQTVGPARSCLSQTVRDLCALSQTGQVSGVKACAWGAQNSRHFSGPVYIEGLLMIINVRFPREKSQNAEQN